MPDWNHASQRTTTLGTPTIAAALYLGATRMGFVHDGRLLRLRRTDIGVEAALIGVSLLYAASAPQLPPVGARVKLDRWMLPPGSPDNLPAQSPSRSDAWQVALARKGQFRPTGTQSAGRLLLWKVEGELLLDRLMADINDLGLNKGIVPVYAHLEMHVGSDMETTTQQLQRAFSSGSAAAWQQTGTLSWCDWMEGGTGSNGITYGEARCIPLSPSVTRIVADQHGAFFIGATARKDLPGWNHAFAESLSENMQQALTGLAPVEKGAILGF